MWLYDSDLVKLYKKCLNFFRPFPPLKLLAFCSQPAPIPHMSVHIFTIIQIHSLALIAFHVEWMVMMTLR